MSVTQKTIQAPVTFKGIGIHSGQSVVMEILPAPKDAGITFIRTDLNNASVSASVQNLKHTDRATSLIENNVRISTPEHVMSALASFGITNAIIQLNNEEVPILDGSALPFVLELEKVGTENQSALLEPIKLANPIKLDYGHKSIIATPQETPSFTYFFEYENIHVPPQMAHIGNMDEYKTTIAPARTFGFEHEIDYLKSQGLALGGSLDNALVIGKDDYLNTPRFENECARHKCLDLIGDCWVAGRPILASIIGIKTSHSDTMDLLKEIIRQSSGA
jgi:UDP-3-O-[3-hydroxymyristoyl] N-acetylglucosamine deacetylase